MNKSDQASATEKRDAAFEIKFVVSTAVAEAVSAWARNHLAPDPHANSIDGDGYRVNSLYFDTSSLDVYRRNGSYGRSKYRVRRYGEEGGLYLERKLKSRGLVSKRRTRIPDTDLPRLAGLDQEQDWIGSWFSRRLLARRLGPLCQVRYERLARVGMTPEGPIRLTIDRDVRAFTTSQYGVLDHGAWRPLLPDQGILELKFRLVLPPLFKSLLQELSLSPQPVSKYRLSVQVFGLDPTPPNGACTGDNGHTTMEELERNQRTGIAEESLVPREA